MRICWINNSNLFNEYFRSKDVTSFSKQNITSQKNCWLAWKYWSNTDIELHDAEEAMGMRKILARDVRMKKNPQTKEDIFWIFTDIHGVIPVQSPT